MCEHEWNVRGYCDDCGTEQPDYSGPDDANMPYLAVNTDTPESTTYPWNAPGTVRFCTVCGEQEGTRWVTNKCKFEDTK